MSTGGESERPETPDVKGFDSPTWAWLMALGVLIAVAVFSFTLLRGGGGDAARGLRSGTKMPPFAAPLVLSTVDGDVNLATRADSGRAGSVPACSVRQAGVLTSCELSARRPLVLIFSTLTDRCLKQLDVLNRVARLERSRATVAAVAIRGDRDRWRELTAKRWNYPVLYDRDGALTSAYEVELCPHITVFRAGGEVASTLVGSVGPQEIIQRIRDAERPPRIGTP